jgi:hypothetical protein
MIIYPIIYKLQSKLLGIVSYIYWWIENIDVLLWEISSGKLLFKYDFSLMYKILKSQII